MLADTLPRFSAYMTLFDIFLHSPNLTKLIDAQLVLTFGKLIHELNAKTVY